MKTIILSIALITTSTFAFAGILKNFKGVFTDQQVNLSWATMMESGVDYYEIQRSGDGVNFMDVDRIESKMTISTDDFQLNYQYSDTHPLKGTSFYRVKVVNRDGSASQTAVVQINISVVTGTKMYPTVIHSNILYVESDKTLSDVKIEIFNLSGYKVSETNWSTLNGRQTVQLSETGSLPKGMYVAKLMVNGENLQSQMLMVQNF